MADHFIHLHTEYYNLKKLNEMVDAIQRLEKKVAELERELGRKRNRPTHYLGRPNA